MTITNTNNATESTILCKLAAVTSQTKTSQCTKYLMAWYLLPSHTTHAMYTRIFRMYCTTYTDTCKKRISTPSETLGLGNTAKKRAP